MPRATIPAPFGAIHIEADDDGVVTRCSPRPRAAPRVVEGGFPRRVLDALDHYLADGRSTHTLDVRHDVPGFHGACLDAMRRIPPGTVVTYLELASMAGAPRAARAAGTACARNPVALLVPCHRVVGSGGRLGGYSGGGLGVKQWLLAHEGARWGARDQKRRPDLQSSYTRQGAASPI